MRYRVTALTPLLVGDGRELSPVDYMVWKDHVNVLDQRRIFKLLARGPRLEGYLAQLRKATKLDFASWGGFAQNFSERRIPFENQEAATIWNSVPPESLFIPTFAADHRGPYLPASALKGALRTSFVASRWTAGTMDRIAASLDSERVPRRLSDSAEAGSGASQTKIVSIADSEPVPALSFKVFLTRVASLDTRQSNKPQLVWKVAGRGSVPQQRISDATPVFAEMAVPGTAFVGQWHRRTFLENEEFLRALNWHSVPDPKLMLHAAREHSAAQLEVQERYAELAELDSIRQMIQTLKRELAAANDSERTCLLCLGWGSGFISKTGFLQTEQESYRKILRAIPAFGKALREGVPFPKTRRIVFAGGRPAALPGWVKLQLDE